MVPDVPTDHSRPSRSPAEDAEQFPSDEQLSQRALWIALLLALGWTVLGLGGALPLYLVSTPCLANLDSGAKHTGSLSVLQDLSLLRLLRLWDKQRSSLRARAPLAEDPTQHNLRIRFIVLTILTGLLAVAPALYKILKEFNRLVAYRRRWITFRCQETEMGWLSASKAPGFATWGEQRFKNFILKTGLSSSLENGAARSGARRVPDTRRLTQGHNGPREDGNLEIDIQSLFSIG